MSLRHVWKAILAAPVAVVLAAILGCPPAATDTGSGSGGGDTSATTPKKEAALIDLKGAKGVIKGKVTLAGSPKWDELNAKHKDKLQNNAGMDAAHCLKGDTEFQALMVKDGGVANAVVYLLPGTSSSDHFVMDKGEVEKIVAERKAAKVNEIDQPFCAFKPHVTGLFTDFYNGKKSEPTGEQLIVKNSAPIGHNTKVGQVNATPVVNQVVKPNESLPVTLNAKNLKPWVVNCDVHKFMEAFVWAFEHPLFAVTNEKGEFEIKGVPEGKDLYVAVWHEYAKDGGPGYLNKGQAKGDKVKAGDDLSFTLTVK